MSTASDTLAAAILITIIGGISARRQNGRFGVRSSGPYERPIGVEPHGADGANGRNRRYLVVAARSGEGPFTDPLRTHSSRVANRYFVEFTAYARARRLTTGLAQLNPSYRETTERI